MTEQSNRQKIVWIIGSLIVVIYALFPIAWVVSLSLKPPTDLANASFLPSHPSFTNYRTVFKTSLFTSALRNSIGIVLISTFVSVLFGTLAAYGIARLDFPGKRLILSVSLAIAAFPVVSLVSPLFNMWRSLHLFDTWPGVIIPLVSFSLPLSIWTLSAFFREIPWEMEQAAQVDGATTWQAFRKVIVPLASPGVFTAAILAFFAGWNDFIFGVALTSTDRARPVPAALAFFTGASNFQSPITAIAAAAVVVTIPVILIVLAFQKRIVAGLTNGAVKG